jgi:hypothetical protein
MTFSIVVLIAVVLVAFWILRPVYVRWRDYLKNAPELTDADFGTRMLVLFKGLRTKMLARLMDGLGVALPAINAIGELIGSGGIDLSGVLPAIPLGNGATLTAAQYSPLVFLGLGRLTDYLRNHTTTPPDTIDPALATKVADESSYVTGSTPSPALAAVTAPTPIVTVTAPARKVKRRPAKRRAA